MPDQIGNINVPSVSPSGTFPLDVPFGFSTVVEPKIVTHQFGAGNTKREQRFYLGDGARRFQIDGEFTLAELESLRDFYELRKGSYQPFTFNLPLESGGTSAVTVRFDSEPIAWQKASSGTWFQISLTLVEVNTVSGVGPTYSVTRTSTRFPSSTLADSLLEQAQTVIPLVHIVPTKAGYPNNIFLSDRRCTVGGQLYLPRLVRWEGIQQTAVGLPGASAAGGQSDDVTLVFGNADRVMRQLADDVQLDHADLQFSLFFTATGEKLDLWAGEIVPGGWQSNVGPEFVIKASDRLSSPFMVFPDRVFSRTCSALFDDGVECPFSSEGALDTTHFPSADAGSCDRGYETPNGCLAHTMQKRYRGVAIVPQAVRFKDNSTGFAGFNRNQITSVSLVSDSIFGLAIPQIYTDIPMPVQALIAAGRDEGDFYEALGILGEGPLGQIASAKLDGQYSHTYPASKGRLIPGKDPADLNEPMSLDYNGNQTAGLGWRYVYLGNSTYLANFSAGIAFVVVRRTDQKGLQLTRLDEHSMEAVVAQGLAGWVWTAPGSRSSAVLTNPVWVAINAYLRSLGLKNADASTQEATFDVDAAVAAAAICDLRVDRLVDDTEGAPGGVILSASVNSGTGYSTGDQIAVSGGDNNALLTVISVDGSGTPTALEIDNPGTGYAAGTTSGSGGAGSGLSLTLTVSEADDGKETQFKFIGRIDQVRATRDWLNDILQNCLGFYTFFFGKLYIGIRENSSAIAAFTDGSMLWRSLSVEGHAPQFNRLRATFADPLQDPATQENQFLPNTATFQDDDYAQELGKGLRPIYRDADINLVGTANISQAARIVNTRGREEVGGVNATERKAARRVSFRTTIMAADCFPGAIISITDAEIPGGSGEFRIESWKLNSDYSVEITARSTTDAMYNLVMGPKPADVLPGPVPPELFPQAVQPRWFPDEIAPNSADAVYDENDLIFDLGQLYEVQGDGGIHAALQVIGKLPVNRFVEDMLPPVIKSQSQASTGGSLDGEESYWACVAFRASSGEFSPPSNIRHFRFHGSANTCQFTLSDIVWPPTAGVGGYVLFVGRADRLMCAQLEETPSALPDSITFSGPLKRATYGPPSTKYRKVRAKAKLVEHGGVLGLPIDALLGNNQIKCYRAIDVAGIDDWAGRKVLAIGRQQGFCPFEAYACTAFDPATGIFTLDRATTGLVVGDVIVVCMQGYDNSSDPRVFADDGLSNAANYDKASLTPTPHSGLKPDFEVGLFARIIAGTGRDQPPAKIIANTPTSYLFDSDLVMGIDSILIIEAAPWQYAAESSPVSNGDKDKDVTIEIQTTNFLQKTMLVGGFIVNDLDQESLDNEAPVRMIYVFGAGLRVIFISADTELGAYDQQVNVDSSAGPVLVLLPRAALMIGRRIVIFKISDDDNLVTIATQTVNGVQETIDGETQWTLSSKFDEPLEIVGNLA